LHHPAVVAQAVENTDLTRAIHQLTMDVPHHLIGKRLRDPG
jgi:hypothetical protein